jgi:hypothetical protein
MTYLSVSLLEIDPDFQNRTRSAQTEQADIFKDDARPQFTALASAVLRNDGPISASFLRMLVAAPGFADAADDGHGGVDSSLIEDAQILSAVQADWPTMAGLFFDADGNRLAGTGGPT